MQYKFSAAVRHKLISYLTKVQGAKDVMREFKIEKGVNKFRQLVQQDIDLYKLAANEILEKV